MDPKDDVLYWLRIEIQLTLGWLRNASTRRDKARHLNYFSDIRKSIVNTKRQRVSRRLVSE